MLRGQDEWLDHSTIKGGVGASTAPAGLVWPFGVQSGAATGNRSRPEKTAATG